MFSYSKTDVFEFSHSQEHAFTGGTIYCVRTETFSDTPHTIYFIFFNFSCLLQIYYSTTGCNDQNGGLKERVLQDY